MCSYELDEFSSLKKNSLVQNLCHNIYLSIYLASSICMYASHTLVQINKLLKLLGVNHDLKLQRMVKVFELHNEMRVK
jgi:hypothetical protein